METIRISLGESEAHYGNMKNKCIMKGFQTNPRVPMQNLRDNIIFWCCMETNGISLSESEAHYGNIKNKCFRRGVQTNPKGPMQK